MTSDAPVSVISHPRSGTHLAIDILRNNFPDLCLPYYSVKHFAYKRARRSAIQNFDRLFNRRRVVKSHASCAFHSFYANSQNRDLIMRANSHICKRIYIYRNPCDTLASWYLHLIRYGVIAEDVPIEDFLDTPADMVVPYSVSGMTVLEWYCNHRTYWMSLPRSCVLSISFEDMIQEPRIIIERISDFLKKPARYLFRDPRLTLAKAQNITFNNAVVGNNIVYTAVNFRIGRPGSAVSSLGRVSLSVLVRRLASCAALN